MHTSTYRAHLVLKRRYTHTHTLTSWTRRTCHFIIAPHQQKATNRCEGALEECVRRSMFTWTCAAAEIQAGHIWKHCSPVAGFLRTAWRLACQTMQPYVTDSSQDQAGCRGTGHTRWVTLYVSERTLFKSLFIVGTWKSQCARYINLTQ